VPGGLLGARHPAARRGIESKDRLGRHRWVVERTFAWLNRQRRLLLRFDHLASQYLGFLHLGCALVCWSYLTKLSNALHQALPAQDIHATPAAGPRGVRAKEARALSDPSIAL